MRLPENDPEAQARMRTFVQGMQQLGWIEGCNLQIDYRFGAADVDRDSAGRDSGFGYRSDGSATATDQHTKKICNGLLQQNMPHSGIRADDVPALFRRRYPYQ
jgi:hypothetical protein